MPTSPGEDAATLAAAAAAALAGGSPGCSATDSAQDADADGASVVFPDARMLQACIADPAVTVTLKPAGFVDHPPDCSAAVAEPGPLLARAVPLQVAEAVRRRAAAELEDQPSRGRVGR